MNLQEAINSNPRLFVGITRIEDLYNYIKENGPVSQHTLLSSGFSKSPMQKGLDALMRTRLVSGKAFRQGDVWTVMYQERKNAS